MAGVGLLGVATHVSSRKAEACLEDGQFCSNNEECCGVCISFNCTDCVPKGGHGCEGPHDCCGGKMDCENGKCVKKKQSNNCGKDRAGVQAQGKGCKKKKKKH
jgi:hypothetical protein